LGQSIKEHGMLQPIVVRQVGDRYQLIAGERRLRAATAAGLDRVPVQVRDADDRQLAELAIVENLQRKDLNPLEKAASFQQYLRHYGCTQDELARRVKIDRSTIANLIRLLELPQAVQQALCSGLITQGHARALLPLGDEREQIAFCLRIQRESLTVRDTEEQVQAMIHRADSEPLSVYSPGPGRPKRSRTRSEHIMALEQELRTALGCKVDIRQTSLGRGRIVVHFKSHQEFERLRNHLTVQLRPGTLLG
jgi:ParB family chromosome partitioning protein